MSRFTLTMLPDGHAILSTPRPLHKSDAEAITRAFAEWRETVQGIAVLAECEVQHATSVDIDLGETQTVGA